jgi:copper chaperone NosL
LGPRTRGDLVERPLGDCRRNPQSAVRSPLSVGAIAASLFVGLLACTQGPPAPAPLDTKTEMCRSCRMPVSDARLAAQLDAQGEEPKFFDDIGCLRDFLASSPAAPGRVAYVADHSTGVWCRAAAAVYTRSRIETPMGSHLIAHADASSRDRDPAAAGGTFLTAAAIFGTAGAPDGRRP